MNHTKPIGSNQMELLIFTMDGEQLYGINVYKVKEIIDFPHFNPVPGNVKHSLGIFSFRGKTLTLYNLHSFLGLEVSAVERSKHVIIAEFNSSIQAFAIGEALRISRTGWDKVEPPPEHCQSEGLLTSVTRLGEQLVEIIDVEKLLADVSSHSTLKSDISNKFEQKISGHVLVVDDSATARSKIESILTSFGLTVSTAENGEEALSYLKRKAADAEAAGSRIEDSIHMVISDIEMPRRDGLSLLQEIRQDPALKNLYAGLLSSISGVFQRNKANAVAVDFELPKWNEASLLELVKKRFLGVESA